MKVSFRTWFLGITTVAALFVFVASTYAWFTTNKDVATNSATSRTGDESIELQLSKLGGNSFKSENTVAIPQVNKTDINSLMPVSTTDLTNFVYVSATASGDATSFKQVNDEKYYYHGRLYLRAVSKGMDVSGHMALYLDENSESLARASAGNMINAARLGLKFDDEDSSTYVLRVSEKSNPDSEQVFNTVVNGTRLGKDKVVALDAKGAVYVANDPAVAVSEYTVKFSDKDNTYSIPKKPLLLMDFNKIYAVDVYYYLEGCDPDCSSSIEFNASDLRLAFYGMLSD